MRSNALAIIRVSDQASYEARMYKSPPYKLALVLINQYYCLIDTRVCQLIRQP